MTIVIVCRHMGAATAGLRRLRRECLPALAPMFDRPPTPFVVGRGSFEGWLRTVGQVMRPTSTNERRLVMAWWKWHLVNERDRPDPIGPATVFNNRRTEPDGDSAVAWPAVPKGEDWSVGYPSVTAASPARTPLRHQPMGRGVGEAAQI
jgi:hypothetical protein